MLWLSRHAFATPNFCTENYTIKYPESQNLAKKSSMHPRLLCSRQSIKHIPLNGTCHPCTSSNRFKQALLFISSVHGGDHWRITCVVFVVRTLKHIAMQIPVLQKCTPISIYQGLIDLIRLGSTDIFSRYRRVWQRTSFHLAQRLIKNIFDTLYRLFTYFFFFSTLEDFITSNKLWLSTKSLSLGLRSHKLLSILEEILYFFLNEYIMLGPFFPAFLCILYIRSVWRGSPFQKRLSPFFSSWNSVGSRMFMWHTLNTDLFAPESMGNVLVPFLIISACVIGTTVSRTSSLYVPLEVEAD